MKDIKLAEQIVSRVNPFELAYNTGQPMVFREEHEIYYYIMCTLRRECPRGYIELPYALHILFPRWSQSQVDYTASKMIALNVPNVAVLTWSNKRADEYFEVFFHALHTIFETEFKNIAFKRALELSKNAFEYLKLKPKTS